MTETPHIPAIPEHERSTGARPVGAISEQAAAANVQQMFDTIAPRDDLLNHMLSVGLDLWWWSRAARTFRTVLQRPEAVVLDLCCGTGDVLFRIVDHEVNAARFNRELDAVAIAHGPERPARG